MELHITHVSTLGFSQNVSVLIQIIISDTYHPITILIQTRILYDYNGTNGLYGLPIFPQFF